MQIITDKHMFNSFYLGVLFFIILIVNGPFDSGNCQEYMMKKGLNDYSPVQSHSKSAPVATTKTLIEVKPLHITPPTSYNQMSDVAPVCIYPFTLGISTVHSCSDLKTMGKLFGNLVLLQDGLENCELLDDMTCDNGSGDGLKSYEAHIAQVGGVVANFNPNLGPCLSVDRKPDGRFEIKTALNRSSPVLCCRPVCIPNVSVDSPSISSISSTYRVSESTSDTVVKPIKSTSTTTTTTIQPVKEKPLEASLPLQNEFVPPPPKFPEKPVETTTTTNAPVTVVTTPSIMVKSVYAEGMCVLPEHLEFPRVKNCEDLKFLALSTDYLKLTNFRISQCKWEDDPLCGPTYPGLGAFINAGLPNDACLAYKQAMCGNLVGPYPILAKHVKEACSHTQNVAVQPPPVQMAPMMMMPMPTNSKGYMFRTLKETFRNLHGNQPNSKGFISDSIVICCRLNCRGDFNVDLNLIKEKNFSEKKDSAKANSAGTLYDLMMSTIKDQTRIESEKDRKGNKKLSDLANLNEPELCNPRYSQVCSLAAPLQGEKIIFDQRCMTENLSGCFAGGMPCCRSVSSSSF